MDPRQWLVLTIRAPSETLLPELTEGLLALGGSAVEERGLELRTYIIPPAETEAFIRTALALLHDLSGGTDVRLEWELEEDRDWAVRWKEGLKPRRVGRRLVVAPTWTHPDLQEGDVLIRVDPEMAFGTGEHPTTRGVLRLMEDVVPTGGRVLDVGTGSGVLAITAALLGAGEVLAVEMDADAVLNAADNLERNGVAERVHLRKAEVDAAFLRRETRGGGYGLILANVLSGVLEPLLPAFHDALEPDGALILSGILEEEAARVSATAAAAALTVEAEEAETEWWSVRMRRADSFPAGDASSGD